MILLYHKISLESPTKWWVTIDDFYRQMNEIQNKKVVYLDEYDAADPDQVVITFDGVYDNVALFAAPILSYFNFPFELFIIGDQVGRENVFNPEEPRTTFASRQLLSAMVERGGRLQWHSKTHDDLSLIMDTQQIDAELQIADDLRKIDPHGFRWLAYPHGRFSDSLISRARKKFAGALSCHQGNDKDAFQRNRVTVTSEMTFRSNRIAVIIPCFNYGRFLPEAVESVLRQTVPASEILIADDASTDNTAEIGDYFAKKHPKLIRYQRNETNLGIVGNFNKAVTATNAEYICFLGADNCFLSNYIEKCAGVLDASKNVAIAYTDMALFGPRAELVYNQFRKAYRDRVLFDTCFLIKFPEFSPTVMKNVQHNNIIHGSSMFRRTAFIQAGGYQEKVGTAEDHQLFLKLLNLGWLAKKVQGTMLEYRQHSNMQANIQKNSERQLLFYKARVHELERDLSNWHRSWTYRISRALKKMVPRKMKDLIRKIQATVRNQEMRPLPGKVWRALCRRLKKQLHIRN